MDATEPFLHLAYVLATLKHTQIQSLALLPKSKQICLDHTLPAGNQMHSKTHFLLHFHDPKHQKEIVKTKKNINYHASIRQIKNY